ncbi:ArsR family transcriptional regulator [Pararhodonellum marinum]|uniref:ArsR family transcriptional regulator n=1 Tax=Pararhodonellum marinum TaxID=2755358 RepID=UPI00293B986F|nr:ArsR family transcriptional regulator [Pararhodonellum marinum]
MVKFFLNTNNQSHLRGLAEEFGESTNGIRKELNSLTEAGFLIKSDSKNKVNYQANTQHPLFSQLQAIIKKHLGLDALMDHVIQKVGDLDSVVLIGDYARGLDSGTIEVVLLGNDLDLQYLSKLTKRAEALIDRKVKFDINPDCSLEQGLILYHKV